MARQASTTTTQIALLGGETLLGRELQDVLQSRAGDITLKTYSASGEGNFGEQEGEPVYLEPLDTQAVNSSLAVIVAGVPEGADKAYQLAKEARGKVKLIDCTGYLESRSEAKIIAPLLEEPKQSNWLLVTAHPVASALASVLKRLTNYRRMERAIINVFEPASERGKRGISELHQQTTGLLAFKPLDKQVFDTQLSFNLLSQYGEEAPVQLSTVEQRIERHLAMLLKSYANGEPIPAPSLRLIQAPVFHGYSISLWIEFDPQAAKSVNTQALGEALASAQIEVRGAGEESPTGVGAAGQSGLMAGDIRVDRNNAHAVWIWVVLDNLRVTADAAADVIRGLGTHSQ
ncbi:MAG: Asd/ArgC dimerization domain-containing protein [Bryobacteraceae bacterium]